MKIFKILTSLLFASALYTLTAHAVAIDDTPATTTATTEPHQCSICLETMTTTKALTNCEHQFDLACISTWLDNHNTCPICRHEVALVDRISMGLQPTEAERSHYLTAIELDARIAQLEQLQRAINLQHAYVMRAQRNVAIAQRRAEYFDRLRLAIVIFFFTGSLYAWYRENYVSHQ